MSSIVQCSHCGTKNRINRLDAGRPVCGKCKVKLNEPGFGAPVELDGTSFDFIIRNSKRPVLVDFWAGWCGPCKMMGPILTQFAVSQEKIRVAKVDTETHQQLAAAFGIQSIPTMILFVNGQEADRITGAMQLPALKQQLAPWL